MYNELIEIDQELPDELKNDIDTYANQGGLLGFLTYFFVHLKTGDDEIASAAASIPTLLFIMSSLHDDAIDCTERDGDDQKRYLNLRITAGDMVYTQALDSVHRLPAHYDMGVITEKVREIGTGQLREEDVSMQDMDAEGAIIRTEERGTVWGEVAICPVEASGLYSSTQETHLSDIVGNILFIMTLIDDVEDLPEDIDNNVVNIPLLLTENVESDTESKQSLIDAFLDSETPEKLREIIAQKERKIENESFKLQKGIDADREALVHSATESLNWYQESVCSVPISRSVTDDRRSSIRDTLTGNDTDKKRDLLVDIANGFPINIRSIDRITGLLTGVQGDDLSEIIIKTIHIQSLIDSIMTTNIDNALANLRSYRTT